MPKLDVIMKPLHCTLSLEQITRKLKLRFGNVRFGQIIKVACWLIINKKCNDRKLEKARKTFEDGRRTFHPVQNANKPHPADLENTAIPQYYRNTARKIIQHRNSSICVLLASSKIVFIGKLSKGPQSAVGYRLASQ